MCESVFQNIGLVYIYIAKFVHRVPFYCLLILVSAAINHIGPVRGPPPAGHLRVEGGGGGLPEAAPHQGAGHALEGGEVVLQEVPREDP